MLEKVSHKKLRHATYLLQTEFLSYRILLNLKEREVTGSLCEGCKTVKYVKTIPESWKTLKWDRKCM